MVLNVISVVDDVFFMTGSIASGVGIGFNAFCVVVVFIHMKEIKEGVCMEKKTSHNNIIFVINNYNYS